MERAAWTDERLDDLAEAMRAGFERTDQDIRELRGDIRDLRSEMNHRFGALETGLRGEIESLRETILKVGGGMLGTMMVGFLSVLAAILLNGS